MTITTFIEIATIVFAIFTSVATIIYNKGKQDALEKKMGEDLTKAFGQLEKIWEWKDSYVKESGEIRIEIQQQIGEIRGKIAVHDNQYAEITRYLEAISDKMDRVEKRLDDLHGKSV